MRRTGRRKIRVRTKRNIRNTRTKKKLMLRLFRSRTGSGNASPIWDYNKGIIL